MILETPHLQLLPFTSEQILALVDGVESSEALAGLKVAAGIRNFFTGDEVSPDWLADLRASTGTNPWTLGFAVAERSSGEVVGTAGFKGEPDDGGMVEIGYGIVPDRQGRGYATEAAAALVEFALNDERVRLIRAHTLPEANASTRVLTKNGFRHLGEVDDADDGLLWRWEKSR